MPTRNIKLTDHFDNLIGTGVASGRFSDASDAVHEALLLLKQREPEDQAKLEWLRSAAAEGFDALDRRDSTTLHSEEELTAFLKEVHEEVLAELATERACAAPPNLALGPVFP